MTEAIIVALITAAASVISNALISWKSRHESEMKAAVERQKMSDRLDNIEHKLDIHNGYAEKLGSITQDIAVIKTEIKNMKGAIK